MPRKQRFKPSRKLKPIPTTQSPAGAQDDDAPRAPDEDRAQIAVEGRVPEHQDRIEAR